MVSRYVRFIFPVSFFFFCCVLDLVSSQLPSNQTNTMTRLYHMIQNETASSFPSPNSTESPFPWKNVKSDSIPCSWKGVSCNRDNSSIVKLSLSWFSISSPQILPVLCQIDTLESLDVSNNRLSLIPHEFITRCAAISGLRLLNFSRNRLADPLPTFNGFGMLEYLDFSHNSLSGNISLELSKLASLKSLNLSYNHFTGRVPTNLGTSNLLEELQLSCNNFQDEIPAELVTYGNLSLIDLSVNNISGSIPDRLGELSKLQFLLLSANNLTGGIPTSISNIQTLLRFAANQSKFGGDLPAGITRYLKNLDLSYNNLNGTIPRDFLSQPNLQAVDLSFNQLEGQLPASISSSLVRLRLGGNLLNGTLPSASFGKSLNLTYLELDNNSFSGSIPQGLGLCQKLALLNLAHNRLSGVLPAELGNLSNLQGLYLQQNYLFGMIPDHFTHMQRLNLSSNSINGSITESITMLINLTNLDLRGNRLSGSIPNSIGSLKLLLELQLGNNQLSGNIPIVPTSLQIALNLSNNLFQGPIPDNLSRLSALEVLDLSNNQFSGEIPEFLASMRSLTQLILSNNQLSGEIPEFLASMRSLTQLILSNNQLSGVIPNFGSFVTVVTSGNMDLKNGTNASPISPKRRKTISVGIILAAAAAAIVAALVTIIAVSVSKGRKWHWIINNSTHKSTMNFSKLMEAVHQPRNIMLKNEFYLYYKAELPCRMNYCIKKIYCSSKALTLLGPDAFAQNIQDLGKLNHPYIMSPLAHAITTPSALIVYEWPQKGSLFDLLHGNSENIISWDDRYRIAVGVATGLAFVHSFYSSDATVVLLHLSTKSIFMKSNSEPLIGDVELHRVISPSQRLGTLSVVAGAVGYIPPEYAYTMMVTTSGNIYSFGIILLELLTGKQAINEGMELAKWVVDKSVENDPFEEILDHRLSTTSAEDHQQMLSMLRIALHCVSVSSKDRPDAKELHTMLVTLA